MKRAAGSPPGQPDAPTGRGVRGTARRTTLTPARVLDAATRIVDAQGPSALTMRRLGAELGVVPMALYNHFADRDAILAAIAEASFGPLVPRDLNGGRREWRERLRVLIRAVHELAVRHPHIYALCMTQPTKPAAAYALMFEAMDALRAAGLSQEQAARWYHTFVILLHGFPFWRASLENYCASRTPPESMAALSPQQRDDIRCLYGIGAMDQFEYAVEQLLDSVERQRT